MRTVHAAEMGALRERLRRLDVEILAAQTGLTLAAQGNSVATKKPERVTERGERVTERGAHNPGREPQVAGQPGKQASAAGKVDGLDGLDGMDKLGDDPLAGLTDSATVTRKRKPRRK
jgi:hypothetical protein